MLPKVHILIDTGIIGGPGRGLFQFLRYADPKRFDYILSNFEYRTPRSTEFNDTARGANLRFEPLKQGHGLSISPIINALRIFKRERCNLVQSHGYKSHVVAATIKLLTGAPWVAFSHGWTTENLKVRIYHALDRLLLRWADVVVTVSPPLFKTLSAIRGKGRRTTLLLNAVDGEAIRGDRGGSAIRRELGIGESTTVLGCFGRLSTEKGPDLLVEAMALEPLRVRDLHLLFVGDGPERDSLRARTEALGLAHRIHFIPYQNAMRDYYEAIDLLVIPSRSEGLPNVLLEAMYFGKPAVATDVGAIPEVIVHGETGWIVPTGETASLANEIAHVIADQSAIRTVGQAAHDSLTPRFDPSERAKNILKIYETVVLNGTTRDCEVRS